VAKKIVEYYINREKHKKINEENIEFNLFEYNKQVNYKINNIGGNNPPVVISDLSGNKNMYDKTILNPDYIFIDDIEKIRDLQSSKNAIIVNSKQWSNNAEMNNVFPIFPSPDEFIEIKRISEFLNFIYINENTIDNSIISKLSAYKNIVLVICTDNEHAPGVYRSIFLKLKQQKSDIPVIIKANYIENNLDDLQIKASCDTGAAFLDGFGDGLWLTNDGEVRSSDVLQTTFGILQASRVRIFKTEYISCPGCGRTLFDIQTAVKKIREKTSHLKNLKIGIMGCIVNGPGEMADADYGYVGAGKGKISLYKNKELVKKNIPEKDAIPELINLIKENGDWHEPDN
ncbi:MAG: flavodoxin-dependent (E)-4-hydroxy-3-methylbut-2-enyl-diphosphate synthase, partial [Bacteroidota bacterium]|nr:flavodoxin-dependent (E)-4-hydroxy-3-methylbut-2-enyl-diphosphate synthase [Bacteroidota bacterium]